MYKRFTDNAVSFIRVILTFRKILLQMNNCLFHLPLTLLVGRIVWSECTYVQAYMTSNATKLLFASHHRWKANPYPLDLKKIVFFREPEEINKHTLWL